MNIILLLHPLLTSSSLMIIGDEDEDQRDDCRFPFIRD